MDKIHDLNWSDLRILLAVRDQQGASGAARFLGTSHQTVSRRLTNLEGALGFRLVNRERHPWVLTVKGTAICEHAARMNEISREVSSFAVQQQDDVARNVSIASNAWGFDILVSPALSKVQQMYPGIGFSLVGGDSTVDVQSGKVDIAVRFTDNPPMDLLGRKIGELKFGIYGDRRQIAALDKGDTREVRLVHLAGHRHDSIWPDKPDGFLPTVTVNEFSTLVSTVRRGLGIAALPKVVGMQFPELKCSDSVTLQTNRSVWILRNKDSKGSKIIRLIEDEIRAHSQAILRRA